MKGFLIREWKPILPGVRWLLCTNPSQSATGQCGWGFHTVRGGFDPGGSPFSSPRCRSCRCIEGLLNRGWGPILPVCGEIVGFPQGATPAARASPSDWSRAGGGGALGQWDWGSEIAGVKGICLLYYIAYPPNFILRSNSCSSKRGNLAAFPVNSPHNGKKKQVLVFGRSHS